MAQTEVRQGDADYNRYLNKKKGLFPAMSAQPGYCRDAKSKPGIGVVAGYQPGYRHKPRPRPADQAPSTVFAVPRKPV
jgi:hypothetical protein